MEQKCHSFSQFLKSNKNSLKITNVSKLRRQVEGAIAGVNLSNISFASKRVHNLLQRKFQLRFLLHPIHLCCFKTSGAIHNTHLDLNT